MTPPLALSVTNPSQAAHLVASARRHLWMHFSDLGAPQHPALPVIVRGDGPYIFDARGRRILDALSGLYTNQLGHSADELAEAGARQARELAFSPIWSRAHPRAIELEERLAALAPGDVNRVFFTSGGSESVESAWKLAKAYFKAIGKPAKHKVISRMTSYHGTTAGALSITGLPALKADFEPLVPSTVQVPNTNSYRIPPGVDEADFGTWAAEQVRSAIEKAGPDTVAAVFLEPVQNAGGCLVPPAGYLERVREICDEYDVLLVSDEVICAFGRLGYTFGSTRYGYQPDIITTAKGLTSGYAPMGAMLVSDRVAEPFTHGGTVFAHGYTFAGHPVAAAVALASLDIFERDRIHEHVRANEPAFEATLARLLDIPIVGEVRGAGDFWAIQLVRDQQTREPFSVQESARLIGELLPPALAEVDLYCRVDNRAEPVIQLAPPLICDQSHFTEIEASLRTALTSAAAQL